MLQNVALKNREISPRLEVTTSFPLASPTHNWVKYVTPTSLLPPSAGARPELPVRRIGSTSSRRRPGFPVPASPPAAVARSVPGDLAAGKW